MIVSVHHGRALNCLNLSCQIDLGHIIAVHIWVTLYLSKIDVLVRS